MDSTTSIDSTSTSSSSTSASSSQYIARQQSFSHSFPVQPKAAINGKGLSASTIKLAKKALQPENELNDGHSDRTMLFSGGLSWLLNAATEVERANTRNPRRPSLLTEDAVRDFEKSRGAGKKTFSKIDERVGEVDFASNDSQRIDAWISQQVEK